jgi:hypothetical protein
MNSVIRTTIQIAEDALIRGTNPTGGGGGGMTQLFGDVLAGPGGGAQAATVVRVNGATVPAAGALTIGAVLRVTGASALAYGPVNLALAAAVTGLLAVANIAPGANTQVLTTTGGVTVWAAPAGGGITQLTGDVTAGPGAGSQTATVVRVNGATVPAAGALTPGHVLQVSGVSALVYGALNLGTATSITGLLPLANFTPGANTQVLTTTGGVAVWAAPAGGSGITQLTSDVLAGPGSGSQAATVVQLTGTASNVNVLNGVALTFLKTGGHASTNGRLNFVGDNGTVILLGARNYTNTGDDSLVEVDGAGNIYFAHTVPFAAQVFYYGPNGNAVIASSTQWTFNNGKNVYTSSPVYLDSGSNLTVGGTAADFGGGAGELVFAPITTAPTTPTAANGLMWFDSIGFHTSGKPLTTNFFTDYMFAPTWQGTNNTQASIVREYAGEGQTVGTATTTILTIPVPTGTVVTIRVLASARDQAGGTVNDGFSSWSILQFKNVAGVVTQGATLATPIVAADTSMAAGFSVAGAVSGTNAVVQGVGGVAAAGKTVDWTMIADVIVD